MFIVVASIGFTGPNAMALAMAEQGERAGTASAIIGQYAICLWLIGRCITEFSDLACLIKYGIDHAGFCRYFRLGDF